LKDKLKNWWEGELEPYRNDLNSDLAIIGPGRYRQHWTSRVAHWAVDFYMREWKWTLGAIATVVGALVFRKF
jgi:hypothetical protein